MDYSFLLEFETVKGMGGSRERVVHPSVIDVGNIWKAQNNDVLEAKF